MVGTLITWLLYALILKAAVALATDVSRERNSVARAFVTAGVLSLGQAAVAVLGPLWILWPVLWLFIIKSVYEIGWWRALLVWLALIVIGMAVVLLILVPMGLMAGLSLAIL